MCVSDNENTSFAFACLRVMVATKEEFQALSGAGGTGAVALPHTVKDIRFPMRWVCNFVRPWNHGTPPHRPSIFGRVRRCDAIVRRSPTDDGPTAKIIANKNLLDRLN